MNVWKQRRERLARLSAPAWISAGRPVPRNYPGNPYPYRASSHFLYLVGRPIPGASLLLNGNATLFVEPAPEDDALWHGPSPSLADLARELEIEVRPTSELQLPDGTVALPAPDAATRREQERHLGRPLGSKGDDALADAMVSARLVHDEEALAELRKAAAATVEAHRAGMAVTAPGVSEMEIRAAMEHAILRRGMTTAYGSIVSVRGEVLHNGDHSGTAAAGDLLLADVGAETAAGWTGDVTRTWPVNGRYSSTQREVYEAVLAAQKAAIAACVVGARYRDVHLMACETLASGLVDLGILRGDPKELVADGVHALLFPHGVGHLLGLDVHDMEDLGDRAGYASGRTRSDQFGLSYLRLDRDLQAGMAVTIEPGFYVVPAILEDPRFAELAKGRLDREVLARFRDVRGIRIEDDVLITSEGPEVLTAALPKDAAGVEAIVGTKVEPPAR
ncbi:MAG: aminopeptidase P family protein [Myxococcota bacterium]